MALPEFIPATNSDNWSKFCELLYFHEELGFWLDVSKMDIKTNDLTSFDIQYQKALLSLENLEKGCVANKDEGRQVGHYWLRNPEIAPSDNIKKLILSETERINKFSSDILSGVIKAPNNKKFTDVFWIGIGGSGLGPVLIVEAFKKNNKGLNFHFLDNVDPEGLSYKLSSIESVLPTTLFVVVSKSGGTPEPLIGMEQSMSFVNSRGLKWSSQAVAITGNNSKLHNEAIKNNWLQSFDLPDWVGGRTSITGAVGLLPLALIGGDLDNFLLGASLMDEATRNKSLKDNPAILLSLSWFKSGSGKGIRDMVVLPYRDRLEVFSRYLQQLVMESLGKKDNRQGEIVNQGIAVYGNKGSTDQHAYVQQLRDGIDNFFVTFVEILQNPKEIKSVNNRRPGDYLSGFLQGTRTALTDGLRQNLTITFEEFNEKSLGALIALFERSVSLYAELVDINAYHQPGVEAGKKAASKVIDLQFQIENLLSDGKPRTINQINEELNVNSPESIFWIVRHLSSNYDEYVTVGKYTNLTSLQILKH